MSGLVSTPHSFKLFSYSTNHSMLLAVRSLPAWPTPCRIGPTYRAALQPEFPRPLCCRATSIPSAPVVASAAPFMSGNDIRRAFLDFYAARGHKILPSASLVPEDPTVLLTIAARHHTFFEMLGNFSFGDYFKQDACKWAWELATEVFKLPSERIFVSVFQDDHETFALWRDVVGVPESHILRMGAEDNFWAAGSTGPCGPCSELYYDLQPDGAAAVDLNDDSRFIEFYNLVFMEYNRDASGEMIPLKQKNIDTGLGLERMAQILQGVCNNYETDLIMPIMGHAAQLAGVDYAEADEETQTALKVIADHTRAIVYLLSDGVIPSNVGRGYVARRLLRRIILKGSLLGIASPFVSKISQIVVDLSAGCDPEVAKNAKRVFDEIDREEQRFTSTIATGKGVLEKLLAKSAEQGAGGVMAGADAFLMYDTYGFPLELTQELAASRSISVDLPGFDAAMEEQRMRSKVRPTPPIISQWPRNRTENVPGVQRYS